MTQIKLIWPIFLLLAKKSNNQLILAKTAKI